MDRAQLRMHLDDLDNAIPALRSGSPDRAHLRAALACMADAIRGRAAADAAFVARRIEELLSWHGLEEWATGQPASDPRGGMSGAL